MNQWKLHHPSETNWVLPGRRKSWEVDCQQKLTERRKRRPWWDFWEGRGHFAESPRWFWWFQFLILFNEYFFANKCSTLENIMMTKRWNISTRSRPPSPQSTCRRESWDRRWCQHQNSLLSQPRHIQMLTAVWPQFDFTCHGPPYFSSMESLIVLAHCLVRSGQVERESECTSSLSECFSIILEQISWQSTFILWGMSVWATRGELNTILLPTFTIS